MTATSRLEGLETHVAIKAPCVAATTANITLSALQTIDGIVLAAGDRVLVKNQTNATENGIWVAVASEWVRSLDFNGSRDAVGGTFVKVNQGTVNSESYWSVSGNGNVEIGTDSITFVPSSGNVSLQANLAASSGSNLIGFLQSGTGATAMTLQAMLRTRDPYLTDFAVTTASSAALVKAAIKNMIAATATGGVCRIPYGAWPVSVTGGLSDAVLVNRAMTICIDGTLTTNASTVQTNPLYLFKVTADNVTFTGNGGIAGPGTYDDTNTGDLTTHPGFIFADTVSGFRCDSLTFDTAPKLSIALKSCTDAVITGCVLKGGPASYTIGNTGYFGIVASGGSGHLVERNKVVASGSGGKLISFVFTGGTYGDCTGCTVRNNLANVHEKVAYMYGGNQIVHDNKGTGAQTDWIRFHRGDNQQAYSNTVDGGHGVVTAYDGKNIQICDNTGLNLTQTGIIVEKLDAAYAGGFDNLVISGNDVTCISATAITVDGIRVTIDGASSEKVEISGNTVRNFGYDVGQALIRVKAVSPYNATAVSIKSNLLFDTNRAGIITDRVADSVIDGNQGDNIAGYLLTETAGARNRWLNNTGTNITTKGLSGLAGTSEASGNKFSTGLTKSTATLVAGTATVATAEVLAGDTIRLFRQATGGTLGHLSVGTITAGTSFVINSSSATDTSVIGWEIVH